MEASKSHADVTQRDRFDADGFYAALDKCRMIRGAQWKDISKATGVSRTTLSRMKSGRRPDAASLAALSAWAGLNPANFLPEPVRRPDPAGFADILLRAATAPPVPHVDEPGFHLLPLDAPRNWTEDYPHENGQYMCRCRVGCGRLFLGYKRRMLCRECANETESAAP